MSILAHNQNVSAERTDSKPFSLYKIGGAAALLAVLVALIDILLTFVPAGAEQPGTMTAVDWFNLFQENWFFGLRNLGLLPNIMTLVLLIPLFLALYAAHRHIDEFSAALAMILSVVGTAIYLSNNAAFPMLALSARYASAATDAQRALVAAAGEAILARGEDFTPGAFMGFLFGEIAIMAISLVMLRGGIFSKASGYAGILGGLSLTIFTIWSTFIPVWFEVAMLLAMFGGILSIVWYILTARRLFQLGNAFEAQNFSLKTGESNA
ncbi:MAG TPA: DUF4386 family protein [Anaerolineales bacterium]|nr:DUF4386 family protein [Anaerolineales bacterium]